LPLAIGAGGLYTQPHFKTNRDKIERLAEALLQREQLLKEEIDQILKESPNGLATGPLPSTAIAHP
jgi:hypothetical protein